MCVPYCTNRSVQWCGKSQQHAFYGHKCIDCNLFVQSGSKEKLKNIRKKIKKNMNKIDDDMHVYSGQLPIGSDEGKSLAQALLKESETYLGLEGIKIRRLLRELQICVMPFLNRSASSVPSNSGCLL